MGQSSQTCLSNRHNASQHLHMLRLAAIAITLALTVIAPAYASPQRSARAEIAAETFVTTLPGLREGETRRIYLWAPANAEPPLPVLYVADGESGMDMVLAHLRQPMLDGRVRALLIVGLEANTGDARTLEYALGRHANPTFERHQEWFLNTVVPWAEQNAGASRNPAERGVGGFSNGADWALATAARHPDMFGLVLAHSPANRLRVPITEATQGRWVMTASRTEFNGEIVTFTGDIASDLRGRPVRRCMGRWEHDGPSWIEVSPGSVTWLYQLGDPASVETETERNTCRTR